MARRGPSLTESRRSVAQQVNGADAFLSSKPCPKHLTCIKVESAQSVSYQKALPVDSRKTPVAFCWTQIRMLSSAAGRLSVPLSHPTAHLGDRKQACRTYFSRGRRRSCLAPRERCAIQRRGQHLDLEARSKGSGTRQGCRHQWPAFRS